jgi:HlyD family secretion protein
MKKIIFLLGLILLLVGCEKYAKISDAYGNFENEEVILSSESTGILESIFVEEGESIEKNQLISLADTTDKHLKKIELNAQRTLLNLNYQKASADLAVRKTELEIAQSDVLKHQNLYAKNVIALEILENYQNKESLLAKQYTASSLSLSIIQQEIKQVEIKLEMANRELDKCYLRSPIAGTILTKFVQAGELVTIGKPVVKLSNLENTYLKAFVTQTQLSGISLNQTVKVLIDGESELQELAGKISFISSKAEFTPKTIQTRDERANLVYAIKISVDYEDAIKIGMPAEVIFGVK